MRELVTAPRAEGQGKGMQGFALASVLGFMVVLVIAGGAVYRNVGTDIVHSGKDLKRVRAEFAAESAVQWGLMEVARERPECKPFTMATHASDGTTPLQGHATGKNPGNQDAIFPLQPSDLVEFPGARAVRDEEGWVSQTFGSAATSISGADEETLSFKAWYPDDSTLRITGRALVEGSRADLDLVSHLRKAPLPL